jgi:hypothetical protein
MVNYRVICDGVKIRKEASVNSTATGMLFYGDMIYNASFPFYNEGKDWVSFTDSFGNERFVCFYDGNDDLLEFA